jgi:predicted RNase H-like HicB family nuclease
MRAVKYTYWQDGDFLVGFLNDYPEYAAQGMTKEELVEHLKDLLIDLESGEVSYVRRVEDLLVA